MVSTTQQGDESRTRSITDLYRKVRARTMQIVAPLETEDYVIQTAEFMSPPRWHIGHTSWFFETLLQKFKPGYQIYSPDFLFYFNSYYEGFGARIERPKRGTKSRPTVRETVAYRDHVDEQMLGLLDSLAQQSNADTVRSLVRLGLEHEMQHQELLVYDIKHLLCDQYDAPMEPAPAPLVKVEGMADIEGGLFWLGYGAEGGSPTPGSPAGQPGWGGTVREGVVSQEQSAGAERGPRAGSPRGVLEGRSESRIRKGIGFASFMHGAGFTGSGEVYLQSVVGAEATAAGRVRILAASTEIGQGTNTIFSQIAAEALGVDDDLIEILQPDTANVPNSGPTVASRTCMVVGKLVESAVLGLKQTLIGSRLLQQNYTSAEFQEACREHVQTFGPLKAFSKYQPPPNVYWDDEKYQGDAYGAYAWAVYVAEVSVDMLTYEAHVDDFVAVQEVGRVINPVLAAGQIEGGVAQAIGFTLFENVVWQNGRMINNQMTNYIIPTPADIPPIRVYFEENPYAYGPGGAKGIGELPMDGAAPAILNAIENATGVSFNHVPLMPEALMETLGNFDGSGGMPPS
ncbi:MAG TPA: hypothetical protein DCK93_17050 [Blastocatellia bacterium]|nr:hypothetical protein [Blastocatellia bacterium]